MHKSFTFRVLLDYEKDVFRDIKLDAEADFEQFHQIILNSFNFDNSQMASFFESNEHWDKGDEISLFDMSVDSDENVPRLMKDTSLNSIFNKEGERMLYVYDFLLMWCFFVELIKTEDEVSKITEPQILISYGEAPNQNEKEADINFDDEDVFGDFGLDDESDFDSDEDFYGDAFDEDSEDFR